MGEPSEEFERLYMELVEVLDPPAWALEPHPAAIELPPTNAPPPFSTAKKHRGLRFRWSTPCRATHKRWPCGN